MIVIQTKRMRSIYLYFDVCHYFIWHSPSADLTLIQANLRKITKSLLILAEQFSPDLLIKESGLN